MSRHGVTALRLTVFVDENDVWHHRPLYHEIVHRAHAAGLSGAAPSRRAWTSWSARALPRSTRSR